MYKEIWKKCNIITFMEIGLTVLGIFFCFQSKLEFSIILLVLAGICDAFDGTFAKKINKNENLYGVELDSLADIVSFGIFPVCIYLAMGFDNFIEIILYVAFIICGITRLAYYNVKSADQEYFHGIPITCSSIILPILFLITRNEIIFCLSLCILSALYVVDIRIKKLGTKGKIFLAIAGVLTIILTIISLMIKH